MDNNNQPTDVSELTVQICAYNEASNIEAIVRRLSPSFKDRLFVIDGGSTDATVDIARDAQATVLLSPKKGLASQRQFGLSFVRTKYVALVDADDILTATDLSAMLKEMIDGEFTAMMARSVAYKPETYWERSMAVYSSVIHAKSKSVRPTNMVGRPAIYVTQTLRSVGFDSFFDGVGCEDTDLSIRMEQANHPQAVSTIIAERKHPQSLQETLSAFKKYGRGDARIWIKHSKKRGNILYHVLVRVLVKRPFESAIREGVGVFPFFFLTATTRAVYFIVEIVKILIMRQKY